MHLFYSQRTGTADAADEADPIQKDKQVPGVTEGNRRWRLAYGLLTPSLRQFPISASDSVHFGWCSNNTVKKVVFALACFPYIQWHNAIIIDIQ